MSRIFKHAVTAVPALHWLQGVEPMREGGRRKLVGDMAHHTLLAEGCTNLRGLQQHQQAPSAAACPVLHTDLRMLNNAPLHAVAAFCCMQIIPSGGCAAVAMPSPGCCTP